jgi:hypothetical protein
VIELFRLIHKAFTESESQQRFRDQVRIFFNGIKTVLSLSLILTTETYALTAWGNCIQRLVGKQYVQLPNALCRNYTDILFGQNARRQDYGGVVCERPDGTYMLLQRLIRQRTDGKAIWEIVNVQRVRHRPQNSFVATLGCAVSEKEQPIVAVVIPLDQNQHQTIMAWSVNLDREAFVPLNPQTVLCRDPLSRE